MRTYIRATHWPNTHTKQKQSHAEHVAIATLWSSAGIPVCHLGTWALSWASQWLAGGLSRSHEERLQNLKFHNTTKWNKSTCFPNLHQIPNDVTAGWAASPVDTRSLGPHLNSWIDWSDVSKCFLLHKAFSIIDC